MAGPAKIETYHCYVPMCAGCDLDIRARVCSVKQQFSSILHSIWIFLRDNEWMFTATGPLLDLGSNSGQCASGLEDPRTLTVLWNPELLLEAVWTVALWTQDPHRASSAKLDDAIHGLVIPKSRILDPARGGGILHPRS